MASIYDGEFVNGAVTPSWASIADHSTQSTNLAGLATIVTSKVTGSGTATAAPFVNTTHFTWQQLKPPLSTALIAGQDRAEYQGGPPVFSWAAYENTIQAMRWAIYLPSAGNWTSNWAASSTSVHNHPVLIQPWARGVQNGLIHLHPTGNQGTAGPSITWWGEGGQIVNGAGSYRMAMATDWKTFLNPTSSAALNSNRFPQIAGPNVQTGASFPIVYDTWMEFILIQLLTTTGGNGFYEAWGQVYGSGVPWVKLLASPANYNTVSYQTAGSLAPAHANGSVDYHRFGGYVYNLPAEIDFGLGGFHTYSGATAAAALAAAQAGFVAETANGAPANTVAPAVTGLAPVGSILACSTGAWSNTPTSFSFQWTRAGSNIASATSSSYATVAADVGNAIGCKVIATNGTGSSAAQASSNTVTVTGAPVNTAAPTVSGAAAVGSTLSTTNGSWNNTPTSFTYQWTRDGTNISSATASTYVTVSGDGTHAVGCTVTATNATGSTSQPSGNSVVVTAVVGTPANTAAPSVSGAAAVGFTLSSTTGSWTNTPTSFAYQWTQDGTNIGSATAATYTTVAGDAGHAVGVKVTATNASGSTVQPSGNSIIVLAAPANTAAPVLSGTPNVGSALTTTDGSWNGSPSPTFTYQWHRSNDGVVFPLIAGATANTYTPTDRDDGFIVRVTVIGTNTSGTVEKASNSFTISEPLPTNSVPPTVGEVGPLVLATPGVWANMAGDGGASFSYQWTRAGADIVGATDDNYATVGADVGQPVGCKVAATNTGGTATAVASANTYTPPALTYQWQQDGVNIGGATGLTYTPVTGDLTHSITVVETATNSFGAVTATSNAIGPIVAASTPSGGQGVAGPDSVAVLDAAVLTYA